MKFAYKFSNLLGTVYRRGNVIFTPDARSIASPVGNKVTLFDLKNSRSETLPIETRHNITTVAISPDGNLMIIVDEEGQSMLISLRSKSVLHHFHFHKPIKAVCFSPDGKKFAVTKESTVLVYSTPGTTKEFNAFHLQRTFHGFYDETVSIDWTTDSKAFCVGGKDMNVRIFGAQKFENLIIYSLGGHTDCIVDAFFEDHSLDCYSISQNGQLCIWECDTELDDLIPSIEVTETKEEKSKILYKRVAKHNFKSVRSEGSPDFKVTSAAFHKSLHILVTGFNDGVFFLHDMPDFNLIHSLSISDQSIDTVTFNKSGDWIGLACAGLGQLLVWEWQSESYVLKQQGHFNNMSCLSYSPDGLHIATGGDDGKVKVWNTLSGICFITFGDHLAGVTGVEFTQSGKALLSSSLDGTVRAFDLNRYRNFRTFTSPRPVQFSCLAVDYSGEIVCAGGFDTFEIFVWSMQTGRLLDILAGHEGPISCLTFSAVHATLGSGSWDKTVKLWDVFENKGAKETISLNSDVLDVSYNPEGTELAVATLNGNITVWNAKNANHAATIEGRKDMGYTRRETDKVTAKKSSIGKSFNTICFSADGKNLLAAGKSQNVCIYSIDDQVLVKRFEITCNLSFDGMEEFLNRRKMTEFGSLALVDDHEGEKVSLRLPGVKKGDMSSRHWKPEVKVSSVRFSPTGRSWAAASTEGLLIYSLDESVVFDPYELELEVTPSSVRRCLEEEDYGGALLQSLRLNEKPIIQQVVESTPTDHIQVIVHNLPSVYVDRVLGFIADQIEKSHHIHFYLIWCQKLLILHGPKLKQRSASVMPALRALQKNLTTKYEGVSKVCEHNKYLLQYVSSVAGLRQGMEASSEHSECSTDTEDLLIDLH